MNNLIIIGNGFDLAHGLKTSYKEFIESINPNQIDILQNQFYSILKDDLALNNWCDIESMYFKQLTSNENYRPYHDPEKLNIDFEVLKKYLSEYLKEQEKLGNLIESYQKLFSIVDSKETRILNFNYTNTLQNLYSNEIIESKVIHIHGELSNPKNPIVFGYAASDEESRQLIDKGNNEYMRNIKKHLYKRTENEKLLTNYLDFYKNINVSIFGHSCGLSDKLILNQILNHKNIESISIFYFEEYEQYFQTQVNIDRIMNNDDNFKKLVNFNSSHRMPQHNDFPKQQQAFIKYITPIIEERKRNRDKNKDMMVL